MLDYIGNELGEIPAHYAIEHSSLDCFDCTAFTKNALDRARYTKERHPELHREYSAALAKVYGTMREQIGHYEAILEAQSDAKGH